MGGFHLLYYIEETKNMKDVVKKIISSFFITVKLPSLLFSHSKLSTHCYTVVWLFVLFCSWFYETNNQRT